MMASAKAKKPRPEPAAWLRSSNDITQQFLAFGGRADVVSLAGGLPAAELYPVADVQQAAHAAIARHGATIMEYGPVEGLLALRQLIAARTSAETGGVGSVPFDVAVRQQAQPVVVEVAEAVSDALTFLIRRLIASVGPWGIGSVSR